MRSQYDEFSNDGVETVGEITYGVQARPQRSRVGKKADKKPPRSKRIKRSAPVGGLHQRRNKRISW